MIEQCDIEAVASDLWAVLGWTRVACGTCGHGVFTRTDDGELVCQMCGEPRETPSNSRGPGLHPDADS